MLSPVKVNIIDLASFTLHVFPGPSVCPMWTWRGLANDRRGRGFKSVYSYICIYIIGSISHMHTVLMHKYVLDSSQETDSLPSLPPSQHDCSPIGKHSPARQPAIMDEKEILDNIDGRMHGPMPGFMAKFFGEPTCTHRDNGLEFQSAAPTPDSFLPWFSNFVSEKYDGDRASWHTFSNTVAANHEQSDLGTSLLLTIPPSPTPNAQTRWSHTQVIGQFYKMKALIINTDWCVSASPPSKSLLVSLPNCSFMAFTYVVHRWSFGSLTDLGYIAARYSTFRKISINLSSSCLATAR